MGRPDEEGVDKNPVLRTCAKGSLNILWGKFGQRPPLWFEQYIHGYKQYLEISSNPAIDKETLTFRHINGNTFKARYELLDKQPETNPFLNIWIAGSVTAHAQVHLMRKMFEIGEENIFYCDTDSIIFKRRIDDASQKFEKPGLGNWTDEHKSEVMTRFWALAPKCYMEELYEIGDDRSCHYELKSKGVRASRENKQLTNSTKIHKLIEYAYLGKEVPEDDKLKAKAMMIHVNTNSAVFRYGTMLTTDMEKEVRAVYGKRMMLTCMDAIALYGKAVIRLIPFNYTGNVSNI